MSYFGYPIDLLHQLASECEATAPVHEPSVREAMLHLAASLSRLSPLYVAICRYGMDENMDNAEVILALRNIIATNKPE